MVRLAFLSLLLLFWSQSDARAQLNRLGAISYEHTEVSDSRLVSSGGGSRFGLGTYRLNLMVPVPINGFDTMVMAGVDYGAIDTRVSGNRPEPNTMHEVILSLGILQKLTEKWRMMTMGRIGIGSDYRSFDTDHLRIGGNVLFIKSVRPGFSYGLGIGVNYNLGEVLPVPLVMINWRPIDEIRINIMLPVNARIAYMVANRFEVFTGVDLVGNRFAVSPEGAEFDNVRFSVLTARLGAAVRVWNGFWLSASAGRTLLRRFDFYDGRDSFSELELDNAWTGRVSLTFRVPQARPEPEPEPEQREEEPVGSEPQP